MIELTDQAVRALGLLIPPHAIPTTDDDALRVQVLGIGGQTIYLQGRMLRFDGTFTPVNESVVTSSSRTTFTTKVFPVGAGWLVDLTILVDSTSLGLNQKFVRVELVRGHDTQATVLSTLIQGSATSYQRRSWPNSIVEDTFDGPGISRATTGTNPAANTEISETVVGGAVWTLLAVEFVLVTDANVANREVALVLDDGTTEFARIPSGQTQAASLARRYTFARGVQHKVGGAGTEIVAPLPEVRIAENYRIRTVTTNIQVGDDYAAPVMFVEENLFAN